MRKFFKGLQASLLALAGAVLLQPSMVTTFVPEKNQAKVAAGIAIASTLLPSLAPRGVRALWGGGQGGLPPVE